jgi:hypothetical protein
MHTIYGNAVLTSNVAGSVHGAWDRDGVRNSFLVLMRDRDGVRNSFLVLMKAIPGKDSQETVPDTVSPHVKFF